MNSIHSFIAYAVTAEIIICLLLDCTSLNYESTSVALFSSLILTYQLIDY